MLGQPTSAAPVFRSTGTKRVSTVRGATVVDVVVVCGTVACVVLVDCSEVDDALLAAGITEK